MESKSGHRIHARPINERLMTRKVGNRFNLCFHAGPECASMRAFEREVIAISEGQKS